MHQGCVTLVPYVSHVTKSFNQTLFVASPVCFGERTMFSVFTSRMSNCHFVFGNTEKLWGGGGGGGGGGVSGSFSGPLSGSLPSSGLLVPTHPVLQLKPAADWTPHSRVNTPRGTDESRRSSPGPSCLKQHRQKRGEIN